jgi:transcriptional regulator of acetoin/glycerol metabolism
VAWQRPPARQQGRTRAHPQRRRHDRSRRSARAHERRLPRSLDATHRTFANAEREALQRALDDAGGNIRAAARTLEISRNTLYRKLRKYNLILD